jgi:hypothetical protein
MNKGAKTYLLYWGNTLLGFNSFLNMPSGSMKYAFRTHRLVILPDYQGLGAGTKFEEFMGETFLKNGEKMFLRTTHIGLKNHCFKSNLWKENGHSGRVSNVSRNSKYNNIDTSRKAMSFEYVGKEYNNVEHQKIICEGTCEYDIARKYLGKITNINRFPIVVSGVAENSKQTVWEKIAKDLGIRTELLWIKQNNKFKINESQLSDEFDAIILSKEGIENLKPFKTNIRSLIAYNYKKEPKRYYEKIV